MSEEILLNIKSLSVNYETEQGATNALNNINISLFKNETLGIVGESGSGKSTIAHAVLRLLPVSAKIISGEVWFKGINLLKATEKQISNIRGRDISIIFQDPFSSLNPVLNIGEQIAEVIRYHEGAGRKQARERAIELLQLVKIDRPECRVNDFPHQFSGGMRQRVMIAMALASSPEVLIADEPTTALDVTIQSQILDLITELKEKMGLATIYITHNLAIVAQMCKKTVVIENGQIAEAGFTEQILRNPRQSYTRKLVESLKYFT
jgi:ABC-type dipeptide/oligopeptide/nickel transport system ATPase component